jgi:FG-GAP repeat
MRNDLICLTFRRLPSEARTARRHEHRKSASAIAVQLAAMPLCSLAAGAFDVGVLLDYPTVSHPLAVTNADVNGDGWPDLAVANDSRAITAVRQAYPACSRNTMRRGLTRRRSHRAVIALVRGPRRGARAGEAGHPGSSADGEGNRG